MKISEDRSFIEVGVYTKHVDEKKQIAIQKENDTKLLLREDKVELSPVAKKIQEAKNLIDSVPDIREQKIASIRMQIENGTYQLNGKKIASRMLKESLLNDLS